MTWGEHSTLRRYIDGRPKSSLEKFNPNRSSNCCINAHRQLDILTDDDLVPYYYGA